MGNNKVDSSWEFVCENRIKSRGEAEKLSPGIYKNKALGLFESVHNHGGGGPPCKLCLKHIAR